MTENGVNLKILFVEDAKTIQMLFAKYLKNTPHRVDFADNGKIGVDKFVSGKYDLVFMDMEMPVMDGYEATRTIRKWESENNMQPVPIIAMTGHMEAGKDKESLAAGCTTHMTKPFKEAQLHETLKDYAIRA